ncbi:unnamed protein product [Ambrosiozyma monospora]|uniref:Unnamed protein product n=1 Tax=Ambrosiozyma monospora TaxID=43982 RepID=A0ACB5SVS7_AMBMO|nr:unnamed protein product [Ambrosiozyma monospora]
MNEAMGLSSSSSGESYSVDPDCDSLSNNNATDTAKPSASSGSTDSSDESCCDFMDYLFTKRQFQPAIESELFSNHSIIKRSSSIHREYTPLSKASSSSASIDCSQYGTFDSSKSTTWHNNGTAFSIQYADQTSATGTWGYDDVSINGVSIKDVNIAVCDAADSEMGVLGISYASLESTNDNGAGSYMNLPMTMKSQGMINKLTYSVYLDDPSADTASVLFGAIDHGKYTGDLALMPIVNSYASSGYTEPTAIDITVSGLSMGSTSANKKVQFASGAAAGLLDTGTTLLYAPDDVVSAITSIGGFSSAGSSGYISCDCSLGDDYYLSFDFQGFVIDVPFSNLFMDSDSSSSSSSTCSLGISSSGDDTFILGDKFLTSVYAVIDLEDNLVAMAKANTNSSSENIEVISKSIPSASSVASYTATYGGAAGTTLAVKATGSLSSSSSGSGSKEVKVAARDVTSTADASSSSATSSSSSSSSSAYESGNSNSNSTVGYTVSTSENSAAQVSAVGALLTSVILILTSIL